jgi:hypothetical protein
MQKQQGDITFEKVDQLPANLEKLLAGKVQPKDNRLILAEGEVTGHFHAIDLDEEITESDAELIAIGEEMLLNLHKQVEVKHNEHKPITLEPGLWKVGKIQEYDYTSEKNRPVMD